MSESEETAEDQEPVIRFETTALKSRLEITKSPFHAEIHRAYHGGFKFFRLGETNTFSLRVSDEDGARGTVRVAVKDEDLEDLHREIGKVLDTDDE